MKLNFWQWLGIILLIGAFVYVLFNTGHVNTYPSAPPAASTTPSAPASTTSSTAP
jgi:hypothetical protein